MSRAVAFAAGFCALSVILWIGVAHLLIAIMRGAEDAIWGDCFTDPEQAPVHPRGCVCRGCEPYDQEVEELVNDPARMDAWLKMPSATRGVS